MKILFGLFLVICSLTSVAHAGMHDVVISEQHVDVVLQQSNETDEQFMVRLMQQFRLFTAQTGFEASGALCKGKNGRMGVTMVTGNSQFSSPAMGGCPLDTPIKGDFIHSHPMPGIHSAKNVIDTNSRSGFFNGKKSKTVYVSRKSAQAFSSADYLVGPGYLVSDDTVLYQEGRGTARIVMKLPEPTLQVNTYMVSANASASN